MMLVMKNKRELCEFAFVVAITVILKKKRNLNKTYTHIYIYKEQTTIATTACNMSVKTLVKYLKEKKVTFTMIYSCFAF